MQSIHEQVREYYGSILSSSDDLKTDATCCVAAPLPKYVLDVMPLIQDEIIERFYGCGSPIPPALEGMTVLDLGCGTGRDVYILSKLVGKSGRVIGVDMTSEQLTIARRHQTTQAKSFGHPCSNVEFKEGYIEDLSALGLEDKSIDVVVSNCVISLSPFKSQVFSEIFRVLKPGGELYFSDVFADRRVPDYLANDPLVRGECLGGALYEEDFRQMMKTQGQLCFQECSSDEIHVGDFALETKLGFRAFTSRTIRVIKAAGLENTEEDYGQCVTYKGSIKETPRYFDFDNALRFIKDKPRAISGNTARILAQSRYGAHFEIAQPTYHRGKFDNKRAQEAFAIRKGMQKVDLAFLETVCKRNKVSTFAERVGEPRLLTAKAAPKTMQVNIGYACNLACRHCYLECGPKKTERMERSTMEHCLKAFEVGAFETLDITGGSPELHADFAWFLKEASLRGQSIVRSNLTLLVEPAHASLMDLFAETKAHIVASLPFYRSEGTDAQRGNHVFERAMQAVRYLNSLGYGSNADLKLDLVYNVSGPFLPPPQDLLQEAYEQVLSEEQGITFDNLFAFNNFPLGRFAADLADTGMLDSYVQLLAENFNALAVVRMMCHDQVTVDYDGRLYDCECNHVLGLPLQKEGHDRYVADIVQHPLESRAIITNPICYSCAAGSGSSCGGSLV